MNHAKLAIIGAVVGTLIGAIAGCSNPPDPTAPVKPDLPNKGAIDIPSSNPMAQVALLTEFDGCKVYRVTLKYEQTYVAKCKPDAAKPEKKVSAPVTTKHSESCGKSCTREITTTTVTVTE
jgi:hypothetical protein